MMAHTAEDSCKLEMTIRWTFNRTPCDAKLRICDTRPAGYETAELYTKFSQPSAHKGKGIMFTIMGLEVFIRKERSFHLA